MNPALQGRILDLIKGSVATAALFLAFIMLPALGLIPGLFAPLPVLYYSLKSGRSTGLGIVAVTTVVLVVAVGPTSAAVYLLQAGIISLALSEFLLRLKGGARSIVYAVAVNLVALLAAAALYGYQTGFDLQSKVTKGVQNSIAQTAALYEKAGVKGDELKALQDSMHQAGELIVTIYPALITVALGLIGCLNLLLLARIAAKARLPVYLGDFRKFRNPDPLVWVLIAAGFGMLVDQEIVRLVSLNILIIVCSAYAVQGFAVLSHFFRKLAVPRFIRLLGCLFLILQPYMLLAVAALGVFDLWGNFRSPNKQENL